MLFKKGELKHLWPFYSYSFLFGLSTMIFPFMVIYFIGLEFSFFEISLITVCYGLTMFIFEVPTGAFADSISRKYSVIIGFIISAASVILIGITSNFYLILIFWSLAGIGTTFVSGAEQAWVISNLNKVKRKDLHHEFFIKNPSLMSLGMILASFIGAFIVKSYSINLLWFIFGFGFILSSLILLLFGKESFKTKKLKLSKAISKTYYTSKKGFNFVLHNKTVFLIILGGLFVASIFSFSNGWQPFLLDLSMPDYYLGYLYALTATIGLVFPFFSKFLTKFRLKYVVSSTVIIKMIILFLLIFLYPPLYFPACFIFILNSNIGKLSDPLINKELYKNIPEKIRATVPSIQNMAHQLFVVTFTLIAGVLLDLFGPQKILAFSGIMGIFAVISYLKIKV